MRTSWFEYHHVCTESKPATMDRQHGRSNAGGEVHDFQGISWEEAISLSLCNSHRLPPSSLTWMIVGQYIPSDLR